MKTKEFVAKVANSASLYPSTIFSHGNRVYTCVNPYSYHLVRKYSDLYSRMDGLFVDGMTMCWWIRFLWGKKIPRLSFDMSSMAAELFSRLNSKNNDETVYFIGAKQSELEGTVSQIKKSYPQIGIKGYRNGYFIDLDDRKKAIQEIIKLSPTFTIVGMGSPLQEQFAIDLKEAGYGGIIFTCGGFLHQSTASIRYYPDWINRFNLRAFYRLFHEKGLWGRLYNVLLEFPVLFVVDSINSKLQNRR